MTSSSAVLLGPWPDPEVFEPRSVPAATTAVTERLRRDGAASVLAVEAPSSSAVDRLIDGPGGPLRLRVLGSGAIRACYLHVHGGGWALGGPDHQDQTLSRFASPAGFGLTPRSRLPAAR